MSSIYVREIELHETVTELKYEKAVLTKKMERMQVKLKQNQELYKMEKKKLETLEAMVKNPLFLVKPDTINEHNIFFKSV